MKKPRPPHDALFKAAFSDPQNLLAELEALLPKEILAGLDLASARLMPGSFVDPELRRSHTDLLWSLSFQDREILLYVLLEHQAEPEELMGFRMLRYMVRIWERWLRRNPGSKKLPAVIPIVVLQGPHSWTAARHFSELLDLPTEARAAIARYLPSFELLIDELAECDDRELRARKAKAIGKITLLLLKSARQSPDLLALLSSMADLLGQLADDAEGLEVVLRYTLRIGDFSVEELQRLLESQVGEQTAEALMTTAERLIQEGWEKGMQKGMQKERYDLVARQAHLRFGTLSPQQVERLEEATSDQLTRCAERILTATSFEDLFAEGQ